MGVLKRSRYDGINNESAIWRQEVPDIREGELYVA